MYGYDIDTLNHIKDTTPSSIKIAIFFIMILLIYIAYEAFLIIWDQKRMEQLLSYKRQLKNYKENCKSQNTRVTNTKTRNQTTSRRQPESRKENPEDMFSDEEKAILQSLGK